MKPANDALQLFAAIYARKSTKEKKAEEPEHERDRKDKSVVRQLEEAREYARKKGWVVKHEFVDDAISGAEFDNRPGLMALLDALNPKPPFHILVVWESSRLGRETFETGYVVKKILKAGVRIFYYGGDREFDPHNAQDKLLDSVGRVIDDMERVRGHERSTRAYDYRVRHDAISGCKIFGYDNVKRPDGLKTRVINEAEAAIVREIYERYARGDGYRQIAWALNARHVPTPRAQRGRPRGWDPGTIRAVLIRSAYRGEEIIGRTKKRNEWGEKHITKRPESEWKRIAIPRIVDERLAEIVDARWHDRNSRYLRGADGKLIGKPLANNPRYLLSGLLICPCGSRFEVTKQSWRNSEPAYMCAAFRRKGPSVCNNDLALPVEATERAILDVIEGSVLTPDFVERVLDSAFTSEPEARRHLQSERERTAREIENLTRALAQGGDVAALVTGLRTREKQLKSLDAALARTRDEPDRDALRHALLQRVSDWKKVLHAHPKQARMVLQQLVGEMHVHSNADRPQWIATPRVEGLLAGTVHRLASLTGNRREYQRVGGPLPVAA